MSRFFNYRASLYVTRAKKLKMLVYGDVRTWGVRNCCGVGGSMSDGRDRSVGGWKVIFSYGFVSFGVIFGGEL